MANLIKKGLTRGEDATVNMFLYNDNERPYNLTGWTSVAVKIPNKYNSFVKFSSDMNDSTKAKATYTGINFTAENYGPSGNNISLSFDNVRTVDQVAAVWNGFYPLNKVTYGNLDEVLYPEVLTLKGGLPPQPATKSAATWAGIPFQSVYAGITANQINLVFDGIKNLTTVMSDWNNTNPQNPAIELSDSKILPIGTVVFSGGVDFVAGSNATSVYNNVNFVSVNKEASANNIILNFNSTDNVSTVLASWNTPNPTNAVTANANSMVLPTATIVLAGGLDEVVQAKASATDPDGLVFTADNFGALGPIDLVYSGADTLISVISAWNLATPLNTCSYDAKTLVLPAGSVTLSGGTDTSLTTAARATNIVTFISNTLGPAGNGIALTFNGVTDTSASVTASWNAANPLNTISHNGNGFEIPGYGQIVLIGGTNTTAAISATGTYQGVVFTAPPGSAGNSITLTFDGIQTIEQVIGQLNVVYNCDSYIPLAGTRTLIGGATAFSGARATAIHSAVTFTADRVGVSGNLITLNFNGVKDVLTVTNTWNMANTTNLVSSDAGTLVLALGSTQLSGAVTEIVGQYAKATWFGINFKALNTGTAGNSIRLVFDGLSVTVASAITYWNKSNPTNAAASDVMNQVFPVKSLFFTGAANATTGTHATGTSTEGLRFRADYGGTNGNLISLFFNGLNTVKQAIDTWNKANATNTVSSDVPNQVLPAATLKLSGGKSGATKVAVLDAELGVVQLNLNKEDTGNLRTGDGQNVIVEVNFSDLRRSGTGYNLLDISG